MEGNTDSPNSGSVRPENQIFKKTITSESLPPTTTPGSRIEFNNTISSNPDEFNAIYMFELADKYKLNPDTDYEKISQMSHDPSITEALKKELEKKSLKSYIVEEIAQPNKKPAEIKKDFDPEFFQAFDHLPNNGVSEVDDKELAEIKNVYIGTGINTPAFNNMDKLGIYGDENQKPTYFSTDFRVAMSHLPDQNNEVKPALIEISLDKLKQYRKVLRDPESLYIQDESGKTFITFHGVPTEAIERTLVLKDITPLPTK